MSRVKKGGLGRGLDAILGDVELAYEKEIQSGKSDLIIEIDVNKIFPNPYQPRKKFDKESLKELSLSIKDHGLIQPIIVIRKDDGYQLIAGERRLRATKISGLQKIKAVVADIKSEKLRELALIENIQRENLNPLELAQSYSELIKEYKITQDELSSIIKKSRTQITNTLRILSLSNMTKDALLEEKITQGHAKIMVGLPEVDEINVLNTIIGQKLSVRQTEKLIAGIKNKKNIAKTHEHRVSKDLQIQMDKLKQSMSQFGKISIKKDTLNIKFDDINKIKNLIEVISN